MIAIRGEISAIENGSADKLDNALKFAPHTAAALLTPEWTHKYSREHAAYPLPYLRLVMTIYNKSIQSGLPMIIVPCIFVSPRFIDN